MTLEEYRQRRLILSQMQKLAHQEAKALSPKPASYLHKKANPTLEKMSGKIPDRAISTLQKAFEKAFFLIFEKGGGLIGKTCNTQNRQAIYQDVSKNSENFITRNSIRRLDLESKTASLLNTSFSSAEGALLGVFGIALPDIPILIAMVLKSIYEISLCYGHDYTNESERIFQLLIICAAVGTDQAASASLLCDQVGADISQGRDLAISKNQAIPMAAEALCRSMLEGKLVQGVPIVGVLGGFFNGKILFKINKMAHIKYKKRFLQGLNKK